LAGHRHTLALFLGLAGAVIVIARERWLGLIHPALFAWVYFGFVHPVTVGADRYHLPSIPYIAMLGGIAVAWVARLRLAENSPLGSEIPD